MATDVISCDQCDHKTTLRAVIGLTENLPKEVLEQITIQAIQTHRLLRNAAEAKCEEWRQSLSSTVCDTLGPVGIAYLMAMIDMHAQQAALSTLLDVLGYIPDVGCD
ncbi:MAG: transcriptional regulator [Mesorhizobium sp.]|uniref:transcriptional repressor TraM n=1 Tax=Mesorhizobium sp. TaxID=1871066 RepID=UPI000FE666B0|nr:transcriptional repressor TraM [Mesorhizobium sp.]RWJ45255.1 MAG: transcriptional regulator [Mesorhizobium sp.]RWJ58191.1 MAG: transcriptional regulator [Mesorhizobium sp.]RWJ66613.1 MAG: transcriptional regulator [Mesorhizobium sp.]RWJ93917.1 MAG: transcriptional regulator [Mesorhizobium sp.]TIM56164.1 MAG: transcriptional regulator [Mesorhizobium sp.]